MGEIIIQNTFNEDTIEVLCEDAVIENENKGVDSDGNENN